MPVEIHQTFLDDIDNVLVFNNTKPIVVDYRDRQHYYLFCTENIDIDAGQYGTLHLQASVWNELPVEQGTKLLPVGINASSPALFTVITRATNKTYAAVTPLQFDLSNISTARAGVFIGPLGIPYYKLASLELTGTWSGTIVVEQCIGGVAFTPTVMRAIGDTTQTLVTSVTTNGLWRIPLVGRYIQARVSVFTSGKITGSMMFFMNSVDM